MRPATNNNNNIKKNHLFIIRSDNGKAAAATAPPELVLVHQLHMDKVDQLKRDQVEDIQ